MCGIIGYIGNQNAIDIILKGLKRMEYRGYDSTGIAIPNKDGFLIRKKKGKVSELEITLNKSELKNTIGMGHTRWATHGEPNDINAHPHTDGSGQVAVIHNGIIENYSALKHDLATKGHIFKSQTDTEVVAHLIEELHKDNPTLNLDSIVSVMLHQIVGAYGLVIMASWDPDKIVVARKGSPLILGIGENEFFAVSDASSIIVAGVRRWPDVWIALQALQHRGLVGQRAVQRVDQLDVALAAGVVAAAEDVKAQQGRVGNAQSGGNGRAQRVLGVVQRQAQFGNADHVGAGGKLGRRAGTELGHSRGQPATRKRLRL